MTAMNLNRECGWHFLSAAYSDKLRKLSLKDQSPRLKCLGGREGKCSRYSCQRKISPDFYGIRLPKTKDVIKYLMLPPTHIELK